MSYQGWSNYPTWAVNLWLANDEGLYLATLELIESADSAGRGRVRGGSSWLRGRRG